MRKIVYLVQLLLVVVVGASLHSPAPGQASRKLPPCKLESPAVYLVVDSTRRHIVDWDTFLNLGYQPSDIVACGEAAAYPEGAPITRLIKGAGEKIYWMENGLRRHIPDLPTFYAMGFKDTEVSVLPDADVASWPLGKPLPSGGPTTVANQIVLGKYTIQVMKQGTTTFHALISAPGHRSVKVPYIYEIGTLPATDVTGDGNPDVLLLRDWNVSQWGHGTVLYNLGARPTKVLDISQGYHSTSSGRGEFKDLNGDGIYEFLTDDQINTGRLPCILVNLPVILQYSPARRRYVNATPEFPDYYNTLIASKQANPATQCEAIVLLLHVDKPTEARVLFDQLYPGSESSIWTTVVARVKQGRYYARKR